jgi:hypothetical protein
VNDLAPSPIIELAEGDISGLRRVWKITRLVAELKSDGSAKRELGYDDLGRVVHRWPNSENLAFRGILDGCWFELPVSPDMSPADFQSLWEEAAAEEVFFAEHDPFGDRFGTTIPWWGCLGALAVLAAVVYAVIAWNS